jgi:hypothetical protein
MTHLSGDAAIQALGAEHRVSDELQIQLATIDKIYTLRRDALVANKELSDAELANAMLRLDLERKRDKEKATADAKAKGGQTAGKLSDLALSIGSDVAQGRGVNVASLTASLGAIGGNVLGNAILPGIGGKIGAVLGQGLGGLVGGIFGHHDTPPVIKSLSAVERAQRETITAIEQQTKDLLLAPQNRFINLPSSFTIPAHRPSSGNTGGDTFNVSITVPVTSGNPADIQHAVELAMGNALTKQRNRRVRF